YETLRRMINRVVTDLIETSRARLADAGVKTIEDVRRQPAPLIGYSDAMRDLTLELKRFLRRHLYAHPRVRKVTDEAVQVIRDLFALFMEDPARLPPQYREKAQVADDIGARARVIADYIAGMTDRYAYREHQRLTSGGR